MHGVSHVLVALDTRRLYEVQQDDWPRLTATTGAISRIPGYTRVEDIRTGVHLSLKSIVLDAFAVPDADIFHAIQRSRATGARTAISLPGSTLPLAGNFVDPSWLSMSLHGHCDSHCTFCYTDDIRQRRGLQHDEALAILGRGKQMGITNVVFTGGEPTLRADLGALIETASSLGYERIGIQTNGHRLASADYLQNLEFRGLTTVLVSLHGPDPETHDRLARREGSFELAVQALTLLARTPLSVTVNFVACRDNGATLARMADFLDRCHPNASLRLSFPIVEGAARENSVEILPTLPEFAHWVEQAMQANTSRHIEVANVPPCISSRLGLQDTYALSKRRSLLQASPFYLAPSQRGELDIKTSRCVTCRKSSDCAGIQLSYLARFPDGAQHLQPV